MQTWKPLLAILPAGLLLGLIGGQASRPVMIIKDERPWPQSVSENRENGYWQPAYGERSVDAYARGYSYRPDLDYDIYAWPDQDDRSGELLAASDYRYGAIDLEDEPRVEVHAGQPARPAVVELARAPAGDPTATSETREAPAAQQARGKIATTGRQAFVLPPVPPPLSQNAVADEPDLTEEPVEDL